MSAILKNTEGAEKRKTTKKQNEYGKEKTVKEKRKKSESDEIFNCLTQYRMLIPCLQPHASRLPPYPPKQPIKFKLINLFINR